jgi:hypothetical protein
MNPGETVQTEPKGQLRKTLRQKYRFLTNLRKVPALLTNDLQQDAEEAISPSGKNLSG